MARGPLRVPKCTFLARAFRTGGGWGEVRWAPGESKERMLAGQMGSDLPGAEILWLLAPFLFGSLKARSH